MAVRPRVSPVRTLRTWSRLGGPASIPATIALALFAGIFGLCMGYPNLADGYVFLFVLPIALLAVRFGLRGGLAGALLAIALIVAWNVLGHDVRLTVAGYLSRGIAALVLGTLLGIFVDERRRLQAAMSRYFDSSLDILTTIDLSGRFTRVNPACERALGYSGEAMRMRATIEFVPPPPVPTGHSIRPRRSACRESRRPVWMEHWRGMSSALSSEP